MAQLTSITIDPVSSAKDIATIKTLFLAYVSGLPIDVSYQNFTHELSTLPGKYSPSSGGALLLARSSISGEALGCVALRSLKSSVSCEMKRLYVIAEGRGFGIGKMLLKRALECAREMGYREVCLDTLSSMNAARAVYKEFDFREIEAYYETPIEGTIFLGLTLEP